MPQYGQYNLANSRLVPKLAGVPIAEVQRVMDVKQNLYRQGEAIYDATGDALQQGAALPASQAAFQELNQGVKSKLESFAQRGDYENLTRELGNTYKDFKMAQEPFLQEYRDYKKWEEDLMKNAELMPETKQKYRQLALMSHQGIKRDPTTGAYVANFTGPGIVKDIDVSKKVEGWLADVVAKETGLTTRVKSADGLTWIESGNKRVEVTPAMLEKAMAYGAALDPEFRAYVGREQMFAGYLNTYNSEEERQAAMKGVTEQLYQNMTKFGEKYLKNNVNITRKAFDSAEGTEAAKQKYLPSMVNSTTTLWDVNLPSKDPKTLGTTVNALTGQMNGTVAQMRNLAVKIAKAEEDGDNATAQVLHTEYARLNEQLNQTKTQRENLTHVGQNIRQGILKSADVQAYAPEWQKLNHSLNARGLMPQSVNGETFTPAEIVMGNPHVVDGRVEFTSLDGRKIRSSITEAQFRKAVPQTPGITTAGMVPVEAMIGAPARGLRTLMGPIEGIFNGNTILVPGGIGFVPMVVKDGTGPGGLQGAINQARTNAFQDQKNFQYSTQQLVFTPELSNSFDMLLASNPTLQAYNVNGKDVKDLKTLTSYGGKLTGVTFDGVGATGEPGFTIQVNKGKKDGKNEFEYYTVQFPGSTAKELLIDKAFYGKNIPKELAQWAWYQKATEDMGLDGKDLKQMQPGAVKRVPGSSPENPLYIKAIADINPRNPVQALPGAGTYLVPGRMVNGEFQMLEPDKAQDGLPIYHIFDKENPANLLMQLPALGAKASLKAKGH